MDELAVVAHPGSEASAAVTWTPRRVLVTVTGDVDVAFAAPGASVVAMLAGETRPVDVDLSGVTLFCAAGVGWLISLYTGVPGRVRVVAASAHVREVLGVCGVREQAARRRRRTGRRRATVA